MQTAELSASFTAFRTESDFARKRYSGVQARHERRRAVSTCILSWVGLDVVMRNFRFDHQRDLLVETLLDRTEIRYIKLGYIDDRPGHRGSALRATFAEFDIRSVIDSTVSIRRDRTSLRRSLFDAKDSMAQAAIVAEDACILKQALRVAVLDFTLLSRWLLGYASDDCWRKRKMTHDESWPHAG
jgi:hypothetical protein